MEYTQEQIEYLNQIFESGEQTILFEQAPGVWTEETSDSLNFSRRYKVLFEVDGLPTTDIDELSIYLYNDDYYFLEKGIIVSNSFQKSIKDNITVKGIINGIVATNPDTSEFEVVQVENISTVALTGKYSDLLSKPTIGNGTIEITKNETESLGEFSLNDISNKTINLPIPTKTSDIDNDSGFLSEHQSLEPVYDAIADVADSKVDKETGKGLSSNDYTDTEKSKLEGIESTLIDLIYPVGSMYWTESKDFNPNIQFNGTWERVKDRFIYAGGDNDTVGVTGGSKKITTANLPNHSHPIGGNTGQMNQNSNGYFDTAMMNENKSTTPATVNKSGFVTEISNKGNLYAREQDGYTRAWREGVSMNISHVHSLPANTGTTGGEADYMPPYKVAYCWERIS